MGCFFIQGVGWYCKKFMFNLGDEGKFVYFEVDGVMFYVVVWINGKIVGGWLYGYVLFCVDFILYLQFGSNQLVICFD